MRGFPVADDSESSRQRSNGWEDSLINSFRQRIAQIHAFVDSRHYPQWVALIGLGLFIGVLEAGAGVLFLGLLAVFSGARESDRIAEWTRILGGSVDPTVVMAVLVMLVFSVKTAGTLAQIYLRSMCVDRSAVGLSHRLVRNYLAAPYEFHLRRHSGELLNNIAMSIDLIFIN